MGAHHMLRNKIDLQMVDEEQVLRLTRSGLANSGLVFAEVTAREVPIGDGFGRDGLSGVNIAMDGGDLSPACTVQEDWRCDRGGYDNYTVEVVDRMGSDLAAEGLHQRLGGVFEHAAAPSREPEFRAELQIAGGNLLAEAGSAAGDDREARLAQQPRGGAGARVLRVVARRAGGAEDRHRLADVRERREAGPQLLVDDELLERSGVSAPRFGPVRRQVAVVGDAPVPGRRVARSQLVEERLHLGAVVLGFRRQLHRQVAPDAGEPQPAGGSKNSASTIATRPPIAPAMLSAKPVNVLSRSGITEKLTNMLSHSRSSRRSV